MEVRIYHVSVSVIHLDFNVANFSCGADDRSPHKRGEDVGWKVRTCIPALHKLHVRVCVCMKVYAWPVKSAKASNCKFVRSLSLCSLVT